MANEDSDSIPVAAQLLSDTLDHVGRIVTQRCEREVLWIDGLDELFGEGSVDRDVPAFQRLLPARLPPGVFVVVTSRHGSHLDWLSDPRLCEQFVLDDERARNVADVERYFSERGRDVAPALAPEYIRRAAEKTQGNFYIAYFMLDEIRRDPTAPRDPEDVPEGVRDLHTRILERVVRAAASEGISQSDVRRPVNARYGSGTARARTSPSLRRARVFRACAPTRGRLASQTAGPPCPPTAVRVQPRERPRVSR